MKDAAIALWHRLEDKQKAEMRELAEIHRKQKAAFSQLMDYACDLDVTGIIDDLAARSDQCFQHLRDGLEALNGNRAAQNGPYPYVGEGVDFSNPKAKPFVQ